MPKRPYFEISEFVQRNSNFENSGMETGRRKFPVSSSPIPPTHVQGTFMMINHPFLQHIFLMQLFRVRSPWAFKGRPTVPGPITFHSVLAAKTLTSHSDLFHFCHLTFYRPLTCHDEITVPFLDVFMLSFSDLD
jgi:hypothetical protein